MRFMHLIKALQEFRNAKKVWFRPRQVPVLIYDRCGSDELMKYIDPDKVGIFDTRGESINVYVLLKTFVAKISKKCNMNVYIDQYIQCVKPLFIITFIDNNRGFYALKIKHPDLVTIFIQNGIRGIMCDIFGLLDSKNSKDSYHVDHMLVFNRNVGCKYAEYIFGTVTTIGSFKNNFYEYNNTKNNTKKGTVLFISEYKSPPLTKNDPFVSDDSKSIYWDDFYASEFYVLQFLSIYCLRRNFILQICGRTNEQRGNEYLFFKSILGENDWELLPRLNTYSSYKHICNAEIVVSIDSTLGYESLARGKKTAILSIRATLLALQEKDFGWPGKMSNQGPFWTNIADDQEFKRILDYITTVSDWEWNDTYKHYLLDLMEYDPGNTRFIKLMQDLGVPLKESFLEVSG